MDCLACDAELIADCLVCFELFLEFDELCFCESCHELTPFVLSLLYVVKFG